MWDGGGGGRAVIAYNVERHDRIKDWMIELLDEWMIGWMNDWLNEWRLKALNFGTIYIG